MTGGMQSANIWAVVPAAGLGRRAGGPKQTFAVGDSTLAATVVSTLLAVDIAAVIVVTRTPLIDALKLPDDPRVEIAVNDIEDCEMIDSVRIGLRHIRQRCDPSMPKTGAPDGVVVIPADIPDFAANTLQRCMVAFRGAPDRIVIATHGTRSGHPIIFPLSMQSVVEELGGGLNLLQRQFPSRVLPVEVGDSGILSDIDTVDDFEKWKDGHK